MKIKTYTSLAEMHDEIRGLQTEIDTLKAKCAELEKENVQLKVAGSVGMYKTEKAMRKNACAERDGLKTKLDRVRPLLATGIDACYEAYDGCGNAAWKTTADRMKKALASLEENEEKPNDEKEFRCSGCGARAGEPCDMSLSSVHDRPRPEGTAPTSRPPLQEEGG